MGRGTHKFERKLDEREIVFLANYYGNDSPTKGNKEQSALAAGYTQSTSEQKALRIIRKYEDCSFRASAKAVGITKPYLAMKLKQILDTGGDKEIIAALRLSLANFGETTDQTAGASGNVFNAPVMMIVGATPERMKALRGALPQLTREQKEEESDKRGAERLEQLKRGELPELKRHSKAKVIDVEAEIPNIDSGNACGDQQATPDAG